MDERTLASLAHARELPFAVDLGSGTLVDLSRFGLPKEPTPQEAAPSLRIRSETSQDGSFRSF